MDGDLTTRETAKWLEHHCGPEVWLECSSCGAEPLRRAPSNGYCPSAYCPTCGARMINAKEWTTGRLSKVFGGSKV